MDNKLVSKLLSNIHDFSQLQIAYLYSYRILKYIFTPYFTKLFYNNKLKTNKFLFGTTLAQNFRKLAQLCDLQGKSHMLECVS